MIDSAYLLNDDAIQDFIVNGYIMVKPALPPDFHRSIFQQLSEMMEKEGNPGNNLLPKVPDLQKIFDDPTVDGALTSILGPNYAMHQHRHCHYHPPGTKAQSWHKDYPIGGNVRYHRVRAAMAFYYPQDVTEEMGPTAIQPGTQYYMTPAKEFAGLSLCGEAGTVTLVHYELWHRATENRSDKTRFMLKFLFCRTEEPTRPSWKAAYPVWRVNQATPIQHQAMWRHLWKWYCGEGREAARRGERPPPSRPHPGPPPGGRGGGGKGAGGLGFQIDVKASIQSLRDADVAVRRNAADSLSFVGEAAEDIVPALIEALHDADEPVRLNAAYALGTIGEPAIPSLIQALREESAVAWEKNLNRNDFTNPSQIDSIYGLAAAGELAVPALIGCMDEPDGWVRAATAAALGCMGQPAHVAVPALIKALKDESEWVRRNAADALGNIGQPAAAAALVEALGDERKVSRWSLSGDSFRENVVSALAKMRQLPEMAVPALQKALGAESEYIRSYAAIALRRAKI